MTDNVIKNPSNKKTKGLREYNENLNEVVIESMQEALIILLKEKEFAKITITDLCKKAGVSRMAFYNNFLSLEELLKSVVIEYSSKLFGGLSSPFTADVSAEWYEKLFSNIKSNAEFLNVLFNAGFKHKFLNIINNILVTSEDLTDKDRYPRILWTGAMCNAVICWVESGMTVPTEEFAAICYKNLRPLTKQPLKIPFVEGAAKLVASVFKPKKDKKQ